MFCAGAAAHARITARPSSVAPAPPWAKWSAGTEAEGAGLRASFCTSATSASVSVWNRLMATTAATPCLVTLLMCARRLAIPASTSSRFSSRYSSESAAPGTTFGARHEWSLSARTVQTTTAHDGRSPE